MVSKEGENLIKEAISVAWAGGVEKVDCKYSVKPKPAITNSWQKNSKF